GGGGGLGAGRGSGGGGGARGPRRGFPSPGSGGRFPPTNPTPNWIRIGAPAFSRGPAITCWNCGGPVGRWRLGGCRGFAGRTGWATALPAPEGRSLTVEP